MNTPPTLYTSRTQSDVAPMLQHKTKLLGKQCGVGFSVKISCCPYLMHYGGGLVPRPHPDFILQSWRKSGEGLGAKLRHDRKWWTRFHNDGNMPMHNAAS